jgi:hypothetical protein
MVTKMKKKAIMLLAIAAITFQTAGLCFATSTTPSNNSPASIYGFINVDATPLNFRVTEQVNMRAKAGSTTLEVDDIIVTNDSTVGVIKVSSVEVEATDGWSLQASDTKWAEISADSKKFSLLLDGYDFATNKVKSTDFSVDPNAATTTIKLTGSTGIVKSVVSKEKAAKIILTIEQA